MSFHLCLCHVYYLNHTHQRINSRSRWLVTCSYERDRFTPMTPPTGCDNRNLIHLFSTLHNNFYVIGGWVLVKVLCATISGHIPFVLYYYIFATSVSIPHHSWVHALTLRKMYHDWISPFATSTTQNKNDHSLHTPTSTCWVHSNVDGLGNTHCIRYITVVDPFLSTSSTMHEYHHLTPASEEVPLIFLTRNPTSIG